MQMNISARPAGPGIGYTHDSQWVDIRTGSAWPPRPDAVSPVGTKLGDASRIGYISRDTESRLSRIVIVTVLTASGTTFGPPVLISSVLQPNEAAAYLDAVRTAADPVQLLTHLIQLHPH